MRATSVGEKAALAISGAALYAFVVAHMLGNLKLFGGPEHFDAYARFLRHVGEPVLGGSWFLWGMRAVLAVALAVHVWLSVGVALAARRARPVGYAARPRADAFASRSRRLTGLLLLLFVPFHLLDLTTGTVSPGGRFVEGAVHGNTVASLRVWWVGAVYLVAVAGLGLHMQHAARSIVQTLGLRAADDRVNRVATATAIAVSGGFAVVPVAVMTGVVG